MDHISELDQNNREWEGFLIKILGNIFYSKFKGIMRLFCFRLLKTNFISIRPVATILIHFLLVFDLFILSHAFLRQYYPQQKYNQPRIISIIKIIQNITKPIQQKWRRNPHHSILN